MIITFSQFQINRYWIINFNFINITNYTKPVTKVDSKKKEAIKSVEKTKKIEDEVKKSVKVYEKGLTKSRAGFVSRLAGLTNKYKKVINKS